MQIHQMLDKCLLIINFKNILAVSPYQCFSGNGVSAYPIRIVSDTRIRIRVTYIRYLYQYPCNIAYQSMMHFDIPTLIH